MQEHMFPSPISKIMFFDFFIFNKNLVGVLDGAYPEIWRPIKSFSVAL